MSGYVQVIRLAKPLSNVVVLPQEQVTREQAALEAEIAAADAARREAELAEQRRMQERLLAETQAVKTLLSDLEERLAELEQRRSQSLSELQQLSIEIAIAVTQEILQDAVSQQAYPIHGVVQRVVERLEANRALVVRMHPLDVQQLDAVLQREASHWQLPANVKIAPDASLQRGTCLADGGDYGLLSTWELQLADIHQCLREGLHDAQVERRSPTLEDRDMRRFPDRRETA